MFSKSTDTDANGKLCKTSLRGEVFVIIKREMIKLFLSTPCYGGMCLEKYATSIFKLQIALIKEEIQLYLDTTEV